MGNTEQEQTLDRIRHFFVSRFTAPQHDGQFANDIREALESPLLRQHIFTNNVVAIVDHAIHGFRYISPQVKDVFGVDAQEFMEKGLDLSLSMWCPEDVKTMAPVFEKVTAVILDLPPEERLCFRFNYDFRFDTPKGRIRVYQQTMPLAVNEAGYPYLLLEIISDVSEYRVDQGINYKLTLNLPDQPIKILFANSSQNVTLPRLQQGKKK